MDADNILDRMIRAIGGKTQSDLGKVLGISQASISEAKRKGKVPPEWFLKLSTEKKLDPNWLLTGSGPMRIGIDEIILGDVIRLVDEYLEGIKKDGSKPGDGWIPPVKKAKLIVVLYNLYAGKQEKITMKDINNLVNLAIQYEG